jgi:transposase InsO family protein
VTSPSAAYLKPELLATHPKQLWSWDITKLKGPTSWTYYDLYVILDVYSRRSGGAGSPGWHGDWRRQMASQVPLR